MSANWIYKCLLETLFIDGKQVPARNHGTLRRRDWTVPAELKFGETTVVPLAAGETLPWQLAD